MASISRRHPPRKRPARTRLLRKSHNATAGTNPTGNVLTNDSDVDSTTNGETKAVSAFSNSNATAGSVGSALAGLYGSLTLNANGSYSYVVDNANAAVQALRTSSDTLTETYSYTMRDTAGATSIATLTITIQGQNDTPVAAGDPAIAVEAGGVNGITTGGVGSRRYRVTFSGPGGHSYGAFGLVNPMYALGQAASEMGHMEVPDNPKTTFGGVAYFDGCSIDSAGFGYRLTATSPPGGPSGATSLPFDITSVDYLWFSSYPASNTPSLLSASVCLSPVATMSTSQR
jgi:VCBS repeat-containing protein